MSVQAGCLDISRYIKWGRYPHACCGSWMWACEHAEITQSLRGPDFLLLHRLLCSYFTRSLCGMAAPDLERVMVKSGAKVIKQHGISFSLFHLLDEDWSSPPKSSGSSFAQAKINHRPRLFTREVKRKVMSNEWLGFSQPPTGFVLYGRWQRAERGLGGLPRSYSINLCPCVHMLLACSNDMDCFDCQHTFCASSTLLGVKPSGSCAFTELSRAEMGCVIRHQWTKTEESWVK